MRFGICVMANVDEIGFFSHAETLGYDSVWVTDSQMLFSDCYAVLALAARQTTRLRLGPGTAICGTRIPRVQVALYVSGFGPRAMELAGKHGDGLVFAIPPRGVPVAEALAHARRGAERAGRALTGFRTCALTNVALLEPGERIDSERIVRTVGPNVMASVYYFYDEVHERGIEPPPFLRPIWKRYCALVEKTPAEHRHFRTHELHYTRLHPGEAELIDADLLRATCLVGVQARVVELVG